MPKLKPSTKTPIDLSTLTSPHSDIRIDALDYHRNGVCGLGFWVVLFKWKDGDDLVRNMMATVFGNTDDTGVETVEFTGHCALFDRDQLAADNIQFARGNSWRGDHFERELRRAIVKYQHLEMVRDFDGSNPNYKGW